MATPLLGQGTHLIYPQQMRLPILGAAPATGPTATVEVYARTSSGISQLFYKDDAGVERPLGPGTMLGLVDSPSSYTNQGLKLLRVNTGETAVEFFVHAHTGDPHHQYLLVDDFPHDVTMHQNAVLPGVTNENFGANYFDIGSHAGPSTPPASVRRVYKNTIGSGEIVVRLETGAIRRLENIFSAIVPLAVSNAGVVGTDQDLSHRDHIHPHGSGYLPDAHHAQSHDVPSHSGTPGGELGGTWTVPTVDATHSGSAHHASTPAHHNEDHAARHSDGGADEVTVENLATAGGAGTVPVSDGAGGLAMTDIATQAELDTHEAASDPHTVYQRESEKGSANGYAPLDGGGLLLDSDIPAAIARDSELHAQSHTLASHSARAHADLSDAPTNAHHNETHAVSAHSGKIGECPFGPIRIVLPKALPGATANATLDDDWSYQSPWTNEAQRISRWYVRFSSNLAAAATFELRKNGTLITGATFTVALGARDAAVDSFTETTLADDDSLEVWQTVGNAEDIGGSAYIYGDQDVVDVVSYA